MRPRTFKQLRSVGSVLEFRGVELMKAGGHYWCFELSETLWLYINDVKDGYSYKVFIDAECVDLKDILIQLQGVIRPSIGRITSNSKFQRYIYKPEGPVTPKGWKFDFANELACNNFLDVCEAYATGGLDAAKLKASEFEQIARPKTSKSTVTESRVGQAKFRKDLLKYWKTCAVTNFKIERLLRASHIKPWSVATPTERLDSFNGLLLLPNLDALFDYGFISFDNQGQILISSQIPETEYAALGLTLGMKLRKINGAHAPYLAYHSEHVFKP
jgi:hypothetical protein